MNEEDLKEQINSLIRDEIQDVINDYVDSVEETKKAGLGFVSADDDKELKVKVSQREIDKICLLYTSPSPRDQRGSRMPSSA